MTKKQNIIYWIVTALFAAFMAFTAIGDVIANPEALAFMKMLGYPAYFTPFIGWAKILGGIAILIPGFKGVREWAYAGFAFDIIGAIYSILSCGFADVGMLFFVLPIGLGTASYMLHRKREK